MNFRRFACIALAAAASWATPGAAAPDTARSADSVRIFNPADVPPGRYEIVKRLWVESWRSAFRVPEHDAPSAALAEIRAQAAELGADGIVHLHCLNDDGGFMSRSSHFCYANAVRLK